MINYTENDQNKDGLKFFGGWENFICASLFISFIYTNLALTWL